MKTDVVIIGGGLAGLVAAITLQHGGAQVVLIEKNNYLGGKMKGYQLGDYSFDYGPNTITMPDVFERVITQTGRAASDYFKLINIPTHTRNILPDGRSLDFTTSVSSMEAQLEHLDPFGAAHYQSFLQEATRLYQLSKEAFFSHVFFSWKDMLSPSIGKAFAKVRPTESLSTLTARYFKNPNVANTFNRYATYIGSSPYKTPATFALIAYLELVEGVYYAEGGNTSIASGYERLARELGVHIVMETEVQELIITNGRASAVRTSTGKQIEGTHFILSADLLEAFPSLVSEGARPAFSNAKAKAFEPSISALVCLVGTTKPNDQLLHHNVFFPRHYENEFKDLFINQRYPKEPTVYISASSKTDPSRTAQGDNLFMLINAPALSSSSPSDTELQRYKEKVYKGLEMKGVPLSGRIETEKLITPKDLQSMVGAYRGAIYGMASNRKRDAFFKPFNQAKDISNLYFAGGSTFPGGGSPMVILSGMNVAKRLLAL
ncbi:phytoene desaturase family protein [Aureibacillus halotolerans]|uniref:4,4'-diaponeurosporene oxygenase n=1 Tax=Aureibacillus halotolerans TaxID=1508390 RepID=A0A4V3D5Z4_9BACI|nr:phytoene desaturase family protein [Aureibacillus halotolerans]TDQ42087.1 phytoene desaturase [Aureibacillus halotolerans]